jgi:hypothetical protein
LLETFFGSDYLKAFDELRKLPEDQQRKAMAYIFRKFPNENRVAERFYAINNMPWMSAETVDGNEAVIRNAFDVHFARLGQFYDGDARENWHEAKTAARNRIKTFTKDLGILDARESLRTASCRIARDTAAVPALDIYLKNLELYRDISNSLDAACWLSADDVSFELVAHELGEENPWSPLTDEIHGNGFMLGSYHDHTATIVTKSGVEELRL